VTSIEVNFDGVVGPTHHYGGLGRGNLASQKHAEQVSSPRAAALQGIEKMRSLVDLGLTQGVLLPHDRPHIPTLRHLGFTGSDAEVLSKAFKEDPGLVSAASSASAMWTANAATVTPSVDAADDRVHLTPANLNAHLHRSVEAATTGDVLRKYFGDPEHFVVHSPIPASGESGDEGAANHTRLTAGSHADPGIALFVHGGAGGRSFRARQSVYASRAIARQHLLSPDRVIMTAQNPRAIDAGVFHNDVIAVGDRDLLLHHELAFDDNQHTERATREASGGIRVVTIPAAMLPVEDAVASYLFNSQLVGLPDGSRLLLAPSDVEENPRAAKTAQWLLTQGIDSMIFKDLRQSMSNGGGPACLRLRVVLNASELAAMHQGPLMTRARLDKLESWVRMHYRDELSLGDLGDPQLLVESRTALDQLTSLLGLGAVYEFQRV
jgi:succinylarginine dihydrolase